MSPSVWNITDEKILIRIESHRLIASDWGTTSLILIIINVVLAAIVSSSLFDVLKTPEVVPAIMSLLVAINSGLIAALDPPGRVEKHRDTISKYYEIINMTDATQRNVKASETERMGSALRFKTRKRARERLKSLGKIN